MIFTDFLFFPFILVVIFIANFILKNNLKFRIIFLTASSYFFYATWDWRFMFLILTSTVIDYFLGLKIEKSSIHKKKYLILSIIFNLSILGFFKYFNFFLDNISWLFGSNFTYWNIILPVGISFYTFQTMSYSIDIYRGKINAEKDFMKFAFFVSFFPQLVAGPIVRASEFLPQTKYLKTPSHSEFISGLQIFIYGLIKKLLIADSLSLYVDVVYGSPPLFSTETLWLATIAYAIQIYCDFSGYSDMAIGTAKMLGFKLVKNFDIPYLSKSITEFWQRWHMSLSRWIKDYIYISLGGNRKGKFRQSVNLLITMLLGGLWHGASINFVVWGELHGLVLIFEKYFILDRFKDFKYKTKFNLVGWFLTFNFVLFTWIFFRAKNLDFAFIIIDRMYFGYSTGIQWIYTPLLFIIPVVIVAHFVGFYLRKHNKNYLLLNLNSFFGMLIIIFIILGIFVLNPQNPTPFVYFQF